MSRHDAIARAARHYDEGGFLSVLQEAVARPTESQTPGQLPKLRAYLDDFLVPLIAPLGFTSRILDNPDGVHGPFLIAERHEGARPAHRADLRPRRHRARLSRAVARRASPPGRSPSRATAGTGAAPPTTRASTSSTSARWRR